MNSLISNIFPILSAKTWNFILKMYDLIQYLVRSSFVLNGMNSSWGYSSDQYANTVGGSKVQWR